MLVFVSEQESSSALHKILRASVYIQEGGCTKVLVRTGTVRKYVFIIGVGVHVRQLKHASRERYRYRTLLT